MNDGVELPMRCEQFFHEFSRCPNETVLKHLVRHATVVTTMREVRIEIPDQLAAWHMLSRAVIFPWTEWQAKTFCGGELITEQVTGAQLNTMGPDHTTNIKDVQKVSRKKEHIRSSPHYRRTIQRKTVMKNPTSHTTFMTSRSPTMRRSTLQSLWAPLSRKRMRASTIWTYGSSCEKYRTPGKGGSTQWWLLLHRLASRLKRDADKTRAEVKASRQDARPEVKVEASVGGPLEQDTHDQEAPLPSGGNCIGKADGFGFDSTTWTAFQSFSARESRSQTGGSQVP